MGELNIKSTTVEKSIDLVQGFLKSLVGQPIEELGLLLTDSVKAWRFKNQIATLKKVKTICEKENIPLRQVNLKVLFPYLEGISLEEDERLQELWANLLINYIDEKKKLESTVFPEILRQLSTKDIKILEDFYSGEIIYDHNNLPFRKGPDILKYSAAEISNLERLGITMPIIQKSPFNSGLLKDMEVVGLVRVSAFGDEFYKACHR